MSEWLIEGLRDATMTIRKWRVRLAVKLACWVGGVEYRKELYEAVTGLAGAIASDGAIVLLREVRP